MERNLSPFAVGIAGVAFISYALFLKAGIDGDPAGTIAWGLASAGTYALFLRHDPELSLGSLDRNFGFTLTFMAAMGLVLPLALLLGRSTESLDLVTVILNALASFGIVIGTVFAVMGFSVFAAIGTPEEVFPAVA